MLLLKWMYPVAHFPLIFWLFKIYFWYNLPNSVFLLLPTTQFLVILATNLNASLWTAFISMVCVLIYSQVFI